MVATTDLEQHRTTLTGHCYRMLGSVFDADDAVQETMVRAWRNLPSLQERAALRSWLYRIATNVCLDLLAQRKRRARPTSLGPAGTIEGPLDTLPADAWLEPIPDAAVAPTDPHARAESLESVRLAFVAALQQLPGTQRAALLLKDVLGCSATEIAECLDTTVPAVNSGLQRARAKLASVDAPAVGPLTDTQRDLVARYVSAFERFDVDELTSLLREDAALSMPPYALWLQGPAEIRRWLLGPGHGCRGSRLVPTAANGLPAFAQYRCDPDGGYAAWALIVLELADDRIVGVNNFLDTATLFPRFGLPARLAADEP